VFGIPAIVAMGGWFTAGIADRFIPARRDTTLVIMERFHERERRVPDTYGVYVRRLSGGRQRVHSDTLYKEFANRGTVSAEQTGWFGRVVSVTVDGRKIEVGQSLRFQLLLAMVGVGFALILVVRVVRHGPRRVVHDVIDSPD
jgi:hypothetical protein